MQLELSEPLQPTAPELPVPHEKLQHPPRPPTKRLLLLTLELQLEKRSELPILQLHLVQRELAHCDLQKLFTLNAARQLELELFSQEQRCLLVLVQHKALQFHPPKRHRHLLRALVDACRSRCTPREWLEPRPPPLFLAQ